MKFPQPTIREILALVVLVAIVLGLDGMRRRRAEYSSRMDQHARQYRERLGLLSGGPWGMQRGRPTAKPDPIEMAQIRYHFEMAEKYERASRFPWLHVEPDPPEPN